MVKKKRQRKTRRPKNVRPGGPRKGQSNSSYSEGGKKKRRRTDRRAHEAVRNAIPFLARQRATEERKKGGVSLTAKKRAADVRMRTPGPVVPTTRRQAASFPGIKGLSRGLVHRGRVRKRDSSPRGSGKRGQRFPA